MKWLIRLCVALFVWAPVVRGGTKITFDPSGVMSIDGRKLFVISFTMAPPPDGKTPAGKDAYGELRSAGGNFMRIPPPEKWDDEGIAQVRRYLDSAAKQGMYGWISLRGIEVLKEGADEKETKLRQVIETFKDHPAIGGYKGSDEPAWGNVPVAPVLKAYRVMKQVDPDHPVMVLHAPRYAAEKLSPYMAACDVTGEDIFPIGNPGGAHSDLPNKQISVVGDETRKIMRAAHGKPVWMTLQIAWSGVARPGKTLRFPTFPQERFMTYEAIIHGARGINYFGATLEQTLSEQDKPLKWNWQFWNRVLRQVVEEIGEKSPLNPALLVENSKLPVKVDANDLDFCVREVDGDVFVLAAKREGATVQVKFTGLPADAKEGEVMFEPPRTVTAANGAFSDWFAPNEVHVYRFHR